MNSQSQTQTTTRATTQATTRAINPHHALKGDLTKGPVGWLLVKMTVPMIWGLAAAISFQLADMYFLSLLGTKPLIAIGFTFPVTMVVMSLTIAMGIATSSIVSRAIGGGNRDEIQRLSTHCLMIGAFVGVVLSLLGLATLHPVFRAMGAGPDIMPLIDAFMGVIYLGVAFQAVQTVGNFILRAGGDAFTPAMILCLAAGLNLLLDPVLIFGLYGLPRLEMRGAAVANVLSYLLAMTASLFILACRKKSVARAHLNFHDFGNTLKRFTIIALPVGIANIVQPVVNGALTGLLAYSGPHVVAAFGITARVEAFAFIIIMALSSGMGPIVGQNWGAKAYARVNGTLKNAFAFACLWSAFVALVLGLGGNAIARLFTIEPEVIHAVLLYFWIVPATYPFGNLVNGWASAFNAMGLPKNAFMLILARTVALTLPLAVVGHHVAGVTGIFTGIAAANIIAGAGGTLLCIRLVREREQDAIIAAS